MEIITGRDGNGNTKKKQQQCHQQQPSNDLEVAAIKAQLVMLVSRLDRIEAEQQTHVS
jgi:hypothetical protein